MKQVLDRHLANTMERWFDSLMYEEVNASCSAVSLTAKELSNILDLFGESYKTTIQIRIADFSEAELPKIGSLVLYQEKELRVLNTKVSTDLNELRLDLGDKYAG